MGIIRKGESDSVSVLSFSALPQAASSATPLVIPFMADASPNHSRPAEPEPPPPPPPSASIEQPPPVFDIPGEVLQAFYEQAIQAGFEEGKTQVLQDLETLRTRFAGALDQLVAVSKELEARNQVQLIALSCQIAEHLVRRHLEIHPQHLLEAVAEAMATLDGADEVLVHCAPDESAFLHSHEAELIKGTGGRFRVRVVADRGLDTGDFRVETRERSVDGRIGARIADVKAMLGSGARRV